MVSSPALSSTLPNLEAFCLTYETGSFTKAARALGVTPQATSRSIARLEEVLGVSLFRRSTRSLAPTDAARNYYEHCHKALSLLADGERALVPSSAAIPEGKVRISAPSTYGHHSLLPALGAFAERYPKVSVDVSVSNQNVDFVRERFDLAIRRGPIADHALVARKLGDFTSGVYASSAYLARRGAPKTPDDLAPHDCISFLLPSSGRALPWSFAGRSLVPAARFRCADDPIGLITLARAGVGLIQIFDFLVKEDVERGKLVEVLAPHRGAARSFTLLYPKQSGRSAAVTAMIEFILSQARRLM